MVPLPESPDKLSAVTILPWFSTLRKVLSSKKATTPAVICLPPETLTLLIQFSITELRAIAATEPKITLGFSAVPATVKFLTVALSINENKPPKPYGVLYV